MDVERSSLCNCVVNFLLEENYLLTAFELLHELLDDGRDVHAIRLKEFFADISQFPPDQISRFNAIRVADTQSLLEEKETVEEKLALSEYELRLAQEDILRLKTELRKRTESYPDDLSDISVEDGSTLQQGKRNTSSSDLGPLKDSERKDVNCAIKEYLLLAGYRLTAMTFYEEVTDQYLDVWRKTTACVPDALRHYYYQYLSSTPEAAEEKISLIQENGSLLKTIENLNSEKESLLKSKEVADCQIMALTKSLDALQKDLKDREILIHDLKQSLELQRKELNGCRAEITSLKMHIEGSRSGRRWVSADFEHLPFQSVNYHTDIKSLQSEIENSKAKNSFAENPVKPISCEKEYTQTEEKVTEIHEDRAVPSHPIYLASNISDVDYGELQRTQTYEENASQPQEISQETLQLSSNGNCTVENNENIHKNNSEVPPDDSGMIIQLNNQMGEPASEKMGLETIQILSVALPKIVPYVLINHREELLPLIMCAIERHSDCSTRDSLTHALFNLIKRPDEQQGQIIMNACVSLAKNVGEMRTESELLPQCWEQINHMYEERRLLVAQSCGELAEFVRPEIRDSLILSILQQLIEDSATVVREAAAHNLALLLPPFPNMDKYLKIEELMFQLVCDPSGAVVETSLKQLVPSVINWGNKLDHILQVLLSHVGGSAQRCPPVSGVEDSVESHLRVLGERERWNVDALLHLLTEVLPFVHQKAINTCPFPSVMGHLAPSETGGAFFSTSLLELYAGGYVDWPACDWVHVECLPVLIQLSHFLPQKEDYLKNRMTKFLLVISESFGDHYLTHVMLPIFFIAVGDTYDLKSLPQATWSRIKGLWPKTVVAERLAIMCVLPLLLAGILGAPSRHEQLAEYLRKILVQGIINEDKPINSNAEVIDAVPYIDAKLASTHVLPALVTLGSDQNLNVKYSSMDAFGAVAQHLKSDMIIEKIRVQMDVFLEDGSHEATIAVIHALVVAVPHTTDRLRDYLLSKIFQLSAMATTGSDMKRRRERANVFCESIHALDATDLPATSVRDFLLPAIQKLFKDPDSLEPAHKKALDIIMRERSEGTFETFSKVMGAHLGIASSVTNFFGEGGLLGKKENVDQPEPVESPKATPITPTEDTRFRRIMRGSFTDMLRGKAKSNEEAPQKQSS